MKAKDMTNRQKVEAIQLLLANRYCGHIYVRECKDGPTHTSTHSRLDGWGMKRSWSDMTAHGYEIKVSRADFMSDDKWPNYLSMCNSLWFVCPWGLLQPEEMPGDVGLLWASKNHKRLYTKKKATYRPEPIDRTTLEYILICRSQIRDENRHIDQSGHWKEWLAKKRANKLLGHEVSIAINDVVADIKRENDLLGRERDGIAKFKTECVEQLGIDVTERWWLSELSNKIRDAKDRAAITGYQSRQVRDVIQVLEGLIKVEGG